MLAMENADEDPSRGTPSMKSRTCWPMKPLRFTLTELPTPPSSRILTPAMRSRACATSRFELRSRLVARVWALNAVSSARRSLSPRTTTSPMRCSLWAALVRGYRRHRDTRIPAWLLLVVVTVVAVVCRHSLPGEPAEGARWAAFPWLHYQGGANVGRVIRFCATAAKLCGGLGQGNTHF